MKELIGVMRWERKGESARRGRYNHDFIITACGIYES